MRVLVSGALGFIGSWISEAFINRGDTVLGIDDLSGSDLSNKQNNTNWNNFFRFYQQDIAEYSQIEEIFAAERPEIVYHCAANAREGASFYDPYRIIRRNIFISSILLELAVRYKVKKFIFTSSISVYGKQKPPFEETMRKQPIDPYGVAKAATEDMIQQVCEAHGMKWTIIRPHNCFDDKTEILVKGKGFVNFPDLSFFDEVATLNPQTQCLEWQLPSDIQRIPHKGDLFHFEGRGHDLLVTGDHHLWLRKTKKDAFDFIRAEDVSDSLYSAEMLCTSAWKGRDIDKKILPECRDSLGRSDKRNVQRNIPMDVWLRLLGWFISEGSVFSTPTNYIVNITNKNPAFIKEIQEIIEEAGFTYYMNGDYDIRIHSKQLYCEFINMAGALNKHIPSEIKELPPHRLQHLFFALMRGDGSFRIDGQPRNYKTISPQLRDDIMEIGIKLGFRVSFSLYPTPLSPRHHQLYVVNFSRQVTPQIGNNDEKRVYVGREFYEGLVYDVTVPNHVILVRRGGKVVWSGNCFGPRQCLSDPYRNVAAIFMNRCMRKEPVYLYGKDHVRAFSYIEDSLPALMAAADIDTANGEIINVGGKDHIKVKTLAEKIVASFDQGTEIIELPPRYGEVEIAYATSEKSEKILGYKEQIGWRKGIDQMARWAKGRGPQQWRANRLALPNDLIPQTWKDLQL